MYLFTDTHPLNCAVSQRARIHVTISYETNIGATTYLLNNT